MRRIIDAGMRVRVMGATVLRRYFPPASPTHGLELLPPGSEDAASFLRTLDAFFYRTSPLWPEAAGRVVAEAMASDFRACARATSGFAEIITHGSNGYVFHPDDDERRFAHLRALRDDRGICGRRRAAPHARASSRLRSPALCSGPRGLPRACRRRFVSTTIPPARRLCTTRPCVRGEIGYHHSRAGPR